MALSARASTVARHVARNVQGVRRMSMVPQDEAIRTWKLWRNVGFGGIGVVVLFTIKEFGGEMDHGHPAKDYPHTKIRNKQFPWGASNCDMFDMECRRIAKGGAPSGH